METIGDRLRRGRMMLNISQTDLAKRLGVQSSTAISGWELNRPIPRESSLRKVCDVTGLSFEWLRDGVGEPFVPSPSVVARAQLLPDPIREVLNKTAKDLIEQWTNDHRVSNEDQARFIKLMTELLESRGRRNG